MLLYFRFFCPEVIHFFCSLLKQLLKQTDSTCMVTIRTIPRFFVKPIQLRNALTVKVKAFLHNP